MDMTLGYYFHLIVCLSSLLLLSSHLSFEHYIIHAQNINSKLSDYEFHSYIEEMIGHLNASVENKQNNNNMLAIAHALHPIEETLGTINERLIQTNTTLSNELSNGLKSFATSIGSNSLNEAINEKTKITKILEKSLDQSIPAEKRTKSGYILNVTAELINSAEEEYSESIFEGKIVNLLEYQDAQQFFKRAVILLENFNTLNENEKQILDKIKQLQNDVDSKRDSSYVNSDVRDLVCEIKGSFYC
jgi:hypothetical protein